MSDLQITITKEHNFNPELDLICKVSASGQSVSRLLMVMAVVQSALSNDLQQCTVSASRIHWWKDEFEKAHQSCCNFHSFSFIQFSFKCIYINMPHVVMFILN